MLTESKFINFTAHNTGNDGKGSLIIDLTEPWTSEGVAKYGKIVNKIIIIDTEEKFNALFKALSEMN